MYNGNFRTARQLSSRQDAVCTQQLDWPFAGGEMRDGMASALRYDGQIQVPTEAVDNTCNVMDQLPPFQYWYMPVGKVKSSNLTVSQSSVEVGKKRFNSQT
jgi:hypothetical protein